MKTLAWEHHALQLLDQTRLPGEERYLCCTRWQEVRDAIRILAVRGAPAIGVAAAYAMVLAARDIAADEPDKTQFEIRLAEAERGLDGARPTAVNLHWAVQQQMNLARRALSSHTVAETVELLEQGACIIERDDAEMDRRIGRYGAGELGKSRQPLTILTHCNAGALATAGIGTALGVIRTLHSQGLVRQVYADETRPLLQGARLTVTELMDDHIPVTLITDNMAAWVMKTKGIDAVVVGADRIAANGDTANKIGTYGVAVLARAHNVPFYVAAPASTFDLTIPDGAAIPIEERNHDEVRRLGGIVTTRPDVDVFNPAFDVTPHDYITGIITEKGVIHHPDDAILATFFRKEG